MDNNLEINNRNVTETNKNRLTKFSKGARTENAPDPEKIMLKIKEQQKKNKRSE